MSPTPTRSKLVGLTNLRAAAIVLVFLYHYRLFAHPSWIEGVGGFGWTGVDLFFVLSGFLISRQLFQDIAAGQTPSLRQFYFKRALRILPAYFVVLACYFCFPSIHEREALPPWWRFVSFTQNFGLDVGGHGTFSHAWSLCIEEQFYLVLPIVTLAMVRAKAGRWTGRLLGLAFGLGLIMRAAVYATQLPSPDSASFELAWYRWIYYPTWSRLDGLLVGIALAALYEFRPKLRALLQGRALKLSAAALLLWFAAARLFAEPDSLVQSIVAFPTIALVYGLFVIASLDQSSRFSTRRWFVTEWLATLSYSIYLTHKACIHVAQVQLGRLGVSPTGTAMFLYCACASLVAALALHITIERPLLRLRDRILKAPAQE